MAAIIPSTTYTITSKTQPKQIYTGIADTVQIINTSTSGTVWVGGSNNITATGDFGAIPVAPSTQFEWSRSAVDVELWAVLDSGAATPVPIIVTNGVDWQPNPIAIGVAVATQLINSGLTIKDTLTLLNPAGINTPPVGLNAGLLFNNSAIPDVSGYNSLHLSINMMLDGADAPTTVDRMRQIDVQWYDSNGTAGQILAVDTFFLPWGCTAGGIVSDFLVHQIRIPVRGPTVQVVMSDILTVPAVGASFSVFAYGSYKTYAEIDILTQVWQNNLNTKLNSAYGGNKQLLRIRRNMAGAAAVSTWCYPGSGRAIISAKSAAGGATLSLTYCDRAFTTGTELENIAVTTTEQNIEVNVPNTGFFVTVTKDATAGFVNIQIDRN